ncbi:MAG: hypothetical protein HYY35_00715 [Deltaproteobacteria bacterium]|nr:hypothetical protein [Deltaproteobacteria bacterium]
MKPVAFDRGGLDADLASLAPLAAASLGADRLTPLGALLEDHEVARLRAALLEVERSNR